jgi:DNA repair protein RadC
LSRFNGLPGVLDASCNELMAVSGLGPSKAAAIKAVLSLAMRYELAPLVAGRAVTDAAGAERFLRVRLGGRAQEVFAVMFLNARHQLLMFEELFAGSVDRAQVYPREVLRRALSYNSAAVVLAHNHPSGNPEPSASDVRLTERLKRLLAEIDVRLLDHLVIGRGKAVSLAERGLI